MKTSNNLYQPKTHIMPLATIILVGIMYYCRVQFIL